MLTLEEYEEKTYRESIENKRILMLLFFNNKFHKYDNLHTFIYDMSIIFYLTYTEIQTFMDDNMDEINMTRILRYFTSKKLLN
jgi:hypothetical protein